MTIVDLPGGPRVSCSGGWYPGMGERCLHLRARGVSLALCGACEWWLDRLEGSARALDPRRGLSRCPACGAVGDPEDNRHRLWCPTLQGGR
jgi:hypothetical protein